MEIIKTRKSHLKGLVSVGKSHWFYEKWLTESYH